MNFTTRLFSTAALLSVAGLSHAQITLDDWTSFNSTNSTFNGTFDGSTSDKIVIVATGEHGFNNDQGNLNSITYDGVSFIKAIDRDPQFAQTDTIYADIWYLDDPGTIHTAGLIEVNATTRGNITVLGLSGTLDGVGNVGVTPTDTRSINLSTTANSFVVSSFSMGGAGNTANVTSVTADSPLTQIAALENGSNWDGQVVGYENNTTAGTQTYSFTGGNTDGSLVIAAEFLLGAPPPLITLEVNTTTGGMTMVGDDGGNVSFSYYEIISAGDTLTAAGWNSLADQDYDGNGPANGSGNGWEEAGGSSTSSLAEAYLLGDSEIATGARVDLGAAYKHGVDTQDLVFRFYTANGKIREGNISYTSSLLGDFDEDGDIDNADIGLVAGGFTGSGTTGNFYFNGDTDGDGDVDNADIGAVAGSFTGALAGNLTDSGTIADLVYDPATGNITLDASEAAGGVITSFQLENGGAGTFNPANYNSLAGTGGFGGFFQDVTANTIGDSDLTFVGASGLIDLGDVAPTGLDLAALEAYLSSALYAGQAGSGQLEFDLVVVPEPSSLALLGLGGLLLARRRRG